MGELKSAGDDCRRDPSGEAAAGGFPAGFGPQMMSRHSPIVIDASLRPMAHERLLRSRASGSDDLIPGGS